MTLQDRVRGPMQLEKVDVQDIRFQTIGAVTQITSITTGVTINTRAGAITTVSQTVAAAAEASFTVTNSEVAIGDVVVVGIRTHTSAGLFLPAVTATAAGSFQITIANHHATAAGDDVLIINFLVLKVKS